jgi:hypothetical protein
MRGGEPIEAVREMFADAELQSALTGGVPPCAHHVFARAGGSGIPARLILRIPHVEVIVMHSHAHKVFRARLYVQIHQVFRIPPFGLEGWDKHPL